MKRLLAVLLICCCLLVGMPVAMAEPADEAAPAEQQTEVPAEQTEAPTEAPAAEEPSAEEPEETAPQADLSMLASETAIPVIAGGLIETKEEIYKALGAGAAAISTGSKELWRE